MTEREKNMEVFKIVDERAKELAQLRQQQAEQKSQPEEEEPTITKRNYLVASIILVIPIIWNAIVAYDHVFRTMGLFFNNVDEAFPKGWVLYDTVKCIMMIMVIGFCSISYEILRREYNRERRCQYGVR